MKRLRLAVASWAATPRAAWYLACGIAILYALGFFSFPNQTVFWSPDEGGRYLDTRQVALRGQWHNPWPYPGSFLDEKLEHVPLQYFRPQEGEIYSWWPHAYPALSSFPYRLFGWRGIFLIPLLSSFVAACVVYRLVATCSPALGAAGMILAAFASPLLFYAFTNWEHTLTVLLVLLSAAAAIGSLTRGSLSGAVVAGTLMGGASYLRIETMMFAAALGVTFLLRLMRLGPFGEERAVFKRNAVAAALFLASFLLSVAPLVWSGPWDETHYLERHYALSERLRTEPEYWRSEAWETLPNLLVGSRAHGGPDLDEPLKWIMTISVSTAVLGPWLLRWRLLWVLFASLTTISLSSMLVLFSSEVYVSVHGLALIAPYTVFAGWSLHPGGGHAREENELWGLLAFSSVLAYLLCSLLAGWEGQGGLQWGPRYALPAIPLLIVAACRGWHALEENDGVLPRRARRALRLFWLLLVLVGLGFQVRGYELMRISKQHFARVQAQLDALPDDALLITSSPVLALNIPRVFETRVLYRYMEGADLLPEWIQKARRSGFRRVCRVRGFATDRLEITCTFL